MKIPVIMLLSSILFLAACQSLTSKRQIGQSSLPVQLHWQTQFDEPINSPPILTEGMVLVSTTHGIYGLDKLSGEKRWQHNFEKYQPSPVEIAANKDIAIYGDKNGTVTALEISSGNVIWRHKPCNGREYNTTSIVIGDDVVYTAFQPTMVEAHQIMSGELIWSLCNSKRLFPARFARLFLDDETLYLTTSEVHILNSQTGKVDQASGRIEGGIGGVRQFFDGHFYSDNWVRDSENLTLARELSNPIPPKLLLGNCDTFRTPYSFYSKSLYGMGFCGGVAALDTKTYRERWIYNSEVYGISPMAIYQDTLYVLFQDGSIHALDPNTGDLFGILETGLGVPVAENASGSVADDEMLLVFFSDGTLWSFR